MPADRPARCRGLDAGLKILDEVRRQRAQQLLLQGLSIREVARGCGFVELSPFYRAFRRWYGQTPEQYRQRHSAADLEARAEASEALGE